MSRKAQPDRLPPPAATPAPSGAGRVLLRERQEGHLTWLTFDRPGRLNSFTVADYTAAVNGLAVGIGDCPTVTGEAMPPRARPGCAPPIGAISRGGEGCRCS